VNPTLITFFLAYFVALIPLPLIISIASRHGFLDRPGFRKIHSSPVPRLGGLSVFLGIWGSWFFFITRNPDHFPYESHGMFVGLFLASLIIWVLGIYDDLVGANAWKKFLVQIVAAIIVVRSGLEIRLLSNPFGSGEFILNSRPLIWVLTVGWIVFITNSINLIDGLDGLASGVCFITSLTLYFIARDLGSPHLPFFALAIAGSCLGFLMFNFAPARIFLGDSGSLVLGFLLACLSIMGTAKRSTAIVMFGPPIILALPLVDTLLAIPRRFFRDQPRDARSVFRLFCSPRQLLLRLREVFSADQEHIHHGLLKIGLSHRSAVVILYMVTMLLGLTAYGTAVKNLLTGSIMLFIALSLALIWLRRRVKRTKLEDEKVEGGP